MKATSFPWTTSFRTSPGLPLLDYYDSNFSSHSRRGEIHLVLVYNVLTKERKIKAKEKLLISNIVITIVIS